MLNKRIINTGGGGAACTTDTTQILDGGTTQSTALYRFEDNANDTAYTAGSIVSSNRVIDLDVNGYSSGTTITDSTSNYNNATIVGNVTYSNPSGSNGRFNLDGASDYLRIGASATFNSAANFTVEGWFKPDNLTAVDHFFTIWDGGSNSKLYLRLNDTDGDLDAYIYTSSGGGAATVVTSNAAVRVKANVFNHIVMTYTDGGSGSLAIYINGALAGSATPSAAVNTTGTEDLYVGTLKNYHGSYDFDGEVGQVRFYSSALTASEVLQNFNATRALYMALDGTASNVTYATGKFGKAAVFNGSNGYITTGLTLPADSTMSFSFWFNKSASQVASGDVYILSDLNSAASHRRIDIRYNTSSDVIFIDIGNGSSSSQTNTGYTPPSDTWTHLVVTLNGTAVKMYINGNSTPVADYTSSVAFGTAGADALVLGRPGAYNCCYFTGKLDQFRIFDKTLSPGEINSLYNETTTTAALATITNPSTIAYYKMADGSDETGSYNGTASNVDFNVQGKYGFAGKFNGSSSQIVLPNSLDSGLGNNNFSYSFWIKGPMTSTNQIWFSLAQNYFIYIGYFSGAIYISLYNDTFSTGVSISVDTWTHIVFVKSSSSGITIYKNGTSAYTSTTAAAKANLGTLGNGQINVIGKYSGGGYQFDGNLDQIRLFNKAISAAEATTLYNEIQCANTITTPESYFNTKLYTGNSGTQSITGVGFQPDLVWMKSRNNNYNPTLYDSVRGTGTSKAIYSNENVAENTYPTLNNFVSFDTNGFTLGATSHTNNIINKTSDNLVSWNWKAGGTAVAGTGNHYINVQKSVADEAGFSIVRFDFPFTPGGNALVPTDASYNHGLSKKPDLIITKAYSGYLGAANWYTWASPLGAGSNGLTLDSDAAQGSGYFGTIDSTKAEFRFSSNNINGLSGVVTYNFRNIDGYQRINSYVGNGSANGPFVYTGFEPAWVLIKNISTTKYWYIQDNKRATSNPRNKELYPNDSAAEATMTAINFYTNGFQIVTSDSGYNTNGHTYLFMAIAANPDTSAPTKANSFKTKLYTGDGNSSKSVTGVGFQPDWTWIKNRSSSGENHNVWDSVRGNGYTLYPNLSDAQNTGNLLTLNSDGFTLNTTNNNINNHNYVSWNWKALDHDRNLAAINTDGDIPSVVSANPAAGFSIVKWTASSTASDTIGSGLGATVEFLITKKLNGSRDWHVWHKDLTNNGYLSLNSNAAESTPNGNRATVTNNNTFIAESTSGDSMIAYCWHSVAGYSKVAYYTGTGGAFNVTLGFTPGWVLIKRADGTGSWTIFDNQRPNGFGLSPDDNYGSASGGYDYSSLIQLSGTGAAGKIEHLGASATLNTSGDKYIYLAFSA